MKTLLDLYLVFFKIGVCSFGGLSMIPVINEEMVRHGWMTLEEVADIIAFAEMTPWASTPPPLRGCVRRGFPALWRPTWG